MKKHKLFYFFLNPMHRRICNKPISLSIFPYVLFKNTRCNTRTSEFSEPRFLENILRYCIMYLLLAVIVLSPAFSIFSSAEEYTPNEAFYRLSDDFVYQNRNAFEVEDNPSVANTLTLAHKTLISGIWTYHWNIGTYKNAFDSNTGELKPQTIQIIDMSNNHVVYTGDVITDSGQASRTDVNWYVFPNLELDAGTYKIVDSHNSSWSKNQVSNGKGLCEIKGHTVSDSEKIDISVIRNGAEEASIRFMADNTGTSYYSFTETPVLPDTSELSNWTLIDTVNAGQTYQFNATGLTSGAKYLHLIVLDGNEIKASETDFIPSNIYLHENFNEYRPGLSTRDTILSVNHITTAYAGANIRCAANDTGTEKYLQLTGSYGYNNYGNTLQQLNFPAHIFSSMTVELDCNSGENGGWFGITTAGSSPQILAGLKLDESCFSTCSAGHDKLTTDVERNIGQWYHVKFELDLWNSHYDFYIDGVKQNNEPLAIKGNLNPECLSFRSAQTNQDTTSRFDNIEVIVHDEITKIDGHAIYRKNASDATFYYCANQPGDCFYLVTEDKTAPSAEYILTNGTKVPGLSGGSCSISVEGLTSGPKYIHFIHKGIHGGLSTITTLEMPCNIYYSDDFNGYRADDYPNMLTTRYCKGSIQPLLNSTCRNLAFKQGGSFGSYPEYHGNSYFILPDYGDDLISFSVDVTPLSSNPGVLFIGNSGSYSNRYCSVSIMDSHYTDDTHTQQITHEYGSTYRFRIDLDTSTKTYDWYVNGIKQNLSPVTVNNNGNPLDCIGIWTGSSIYGNTALLDNMEIKIQSPTALGLSSIKFMEYPPSSTTAAKLGGKKFTILNNAGKATDINVIAAYYDINGKLLDIQSVFLSAIPDKGTSTFELNGCEKASSAKIFSLSALGWTPLCPALSYSSGD